MPTDDQDQAVVQITNVAAGHVLFIVGEHDRGVDSAKALSQHVTKWYKETMPAVVLSALPIVDKGETTAVHIWFK